MQQVPTSAPSASFRFLLAAVLGFIGIYDLRAGITGEGLGIFLIGLAVTIYAALLLGDAVHIKRTGHTVMSRKRTNYIRLACLALLIIGVLVKRSPQMASFFG